MKGKILLALLVIFLLAAGAYAASVFASYSEGYRAGQIIKMSKKGFLFKTNEGQLNTGGGFGGEGDMTSSIWDFSVARSDKEVLKKIEHAVDGQYRVKLHYKEKFFKHGWRGDTKYFVFDVEEMENSNGNSQSNPANQNAVPGANNPNAVPGANNPNAVPSTNSRPANQNAVSGTNTQIAIPGAKNNNIAIPGANGRPANRNINRANSELEKRMTIEEARRIIANEKRGSGGQDPQSDDGHPTP